MGAEERLGLATILMMRCMTCDYGSPKYKLYQEVDTKAPGMKAATSHLSLRLGSSGTILGNDGTRKILLSTNTSSTSRKALQKSNHTVIPLIGALIESDMSQRCRQVVDVNTVRRCESAPLKGTKSFLRLCQQQLRLKKILLHNFALDAVARFTAEINQA